MIEILKCPFLGSGFGTKAKGLIKGLLEKTMGNLPQVNSPILLGLVGGG